MIIEVFLVQTKRSPCARACLCVLLTTSVYLGTFAAKQKPVLTTGLWASLLRAGMGIWAPQGFLRIPASAYRSGRGRGVPEESSAVMANSSAFASVYYGRLFPCTVCCAWPYGRAFMRVVTAVLATAPHKPLGITRSESFAADPGIYLFVIRGDLWPLGAGRSPVPESIQSEQGLARSSSLVSTSVTLVL